MTYVPAIIDDYMIAAFFYLGYYGKGPSVLPTSCKVTDTDDEGTNVQTYSCSYTLNSDGTVNTFNPNRSLGFLCVVRQREIL